MCSAGLLILLLGYVFNEKVIETVTVHKNGRSSSSFLINSEFRIQNIFSRDSYSNVFTVKTLVSQNFYLKVNRKNHRSKKSMEQWNLLIYVTNTAKEKVVLFQ